MNWFSRLMLLTIAAPILCGAALVVAYVPLVGLTIPQLPAWAQPGVTKWMVDIPQHSEKSDNGSYGDSSQAGPSAVKWDGHFSLDSDIYGLPFRGPIQHWSDWYDKPLLGCMFHDPNYDSHRGQTSRSMREHPFTQRFPARWSGRMRTARGGILS